MDLLSQVDRATIWQRLHELVDGPVGAELGLCGRMSQYQFLLSVVRRRWSLPWRAAFRGTVLNTANGTLMTGKFDSNWALFFIGYPVLAAVAANVGVNVIVGNATEHAGELLLFCLAAAGLCVALDAIHRRDERRIAATLHAIMTTPRTAQS